jgi:(R,R)-butanediol dehydrogenase / meso-butanediol dehydrogenase / diacetyl reductase
MLAAVFHGREQIRVEERPPPPAPGPGWVQVAVSWCGICGTDLDELLHGPVLVPTAPHPLTGAQAPLVLGHEAAGVVVAAGDQAALAVGDRVGLENTHSCGRCPRCLAGDPQLCAAVAVMGLMFDGALAERVNVPAAMCAVLPDAISDEAGALAEPLSVAVRAVRRAGALRGRTAAVVGAGTIGLLVAAVARAEGAAGVAIIEQSPDRLRRALAQGYEPAMPGAEMDVVFECAGSGPGFQAALDATGKQGTTVVVGIHAEPRTLDVTDLVVDERALVASFSHNLRDDYRGALALLAAGAVRPADFITDRVPLSEVVERGFRPLIAEPERHLKVLVDCRP